MLTSVSPHLLSRTGKDNDGQTMRGIGSNYHGYNKVSLNEFRFVVAGVC